MDLIGCLNTKTGGVVEYPFPHSENTMREFFYDPQCHTCVFNAGQQQGWYFELAAN
jgi:hypothetical protein